MQLVGERWALLIVQDLLLGPKRFTDLRQGLPRIPTNVLSRRLKELEDAGVVRRRILPRPSGSVVYELTAYGCELDEVLLRLCRWGSRRLREPVPGEIFTVDSTVMLLRSAFRPAAAGDGAVSYELWVDDAVLHVRVADGRLAVDPGTAPTADLVIEAGRALRALLSGIEAAGAAVTGGAVRLAGDRGLLPRFASTFQI